MRHYGFIVKNPSLELLKHHARIASDQFNGAFAGVATLEEAMAVAMEMLTKSVESIELSGDFTAEEADKIRAAISNRVPVGRVVYD